MVACTITLLVLLNIHLLTTLSVLTGTYGESAKKDFSLNKKI